MEVRIRTYEDGDFMILLEREKFVSDLSLMKERAVRLGFYATAQRLDYPIRMVGFEMSGDVDDCLKYEKDLERLVK